MGVKLGRLHWGRNVGWGCLRVGCGGEYLGLRGTKQWEWRKLHNEVSNDLYSSPNIFRMTKSRQMWWEGHVARMGERRGVCRSLVWKPEGKRPFGRPRLRWKNNIKMDLQEVGRGNMDWIELAQDRDRWRALVYVVMKLRVPLNAGNFLTSRKPAGYSRRTVFHWVIK